ncbi:MAG: hypothetical protein ACFE96_00430 [Candidatus Hermodarchaeota archaeon]
MVFGILALICGIAGFFAWLALMLILPFGLGYFSYMWVPFMAIIFGIVGIFVEDKKYKAVLGMVLGIIAIITLLIMFLPLYFI